MLTPPEVLAGFLGEGFSLMGFAWIQDADDGRPKVASQGGDAQHHRSGLASDSGVFYGLLTTSVHSYPLP